MYQAECYGLSSDHLNQISFACCQSIVVVLTPTFPQQPHRGRTGRTSGSLHNRWLSLMRGQHQSPAVWGMLLLSWHFLCSWPPDEISSKQQLYAFTLIIQIINMLMMYLCCSLCTLELLREQNCRPWVLGTWCFGNNAMFYRTEL